MQEGLEFNKITALFSLINVLFLLAAIALGIYIFRDARKHNVKMGSAILWGVFSAACWPIVLLYFFYRKKNAL